MLSKFIILRDALVEPFDRTPLIVFELQDSVPLFVSAGTDLDPTMDLHNESGDK